MKERCYGCGRHPRVCWIMPCLVLEIALAKGTKALKAWGRRSGLVPR